MPNYDLIAILGPTASGKTPFAAALADVPARRAEKCVDGNVKERRQALERFRVGERFTVLPA